MAGSVLSFVSQKGGVGKTTSAINLAVAFAMSGSKVLLLDLDPQSSVRYSFGIENVKAGSKEWILGVNEQLDSIVIKTKEHANLDFLVSNINSLTDEKEISRRLVAHDYLSGLLDSTALEYDIVIIDAPASTGNLSINAMIASDLIIMPLQCENLAIKSLKRFLASFHELQSNFKDRELRLGGILITRFNHNSEIHQKIAHQLYSNLSNVVFQSIIPDTEDVIKASALGQSVISFKLSSIASTAYIRLMQELKSKFDIA